MEHAEEIFKIVRETASENFRSEAKRKRVEQELINGRKELKRVRLEESRARLTELAQESRNENVDLTEVVVSIFVFLLGRLCD